MKPIYTLWLFLFAFTNAFSNQNQRLENWTQFPLTFEFTSIDTNVFSDDKVHIEGGFPFVNTSDTLAIVIMVYSSYGGLVPYYTKKPIMPGESDSIGFHLTFGKGNMGRFHKILTVKVLCNGIKQQKRLEIKGVVRSMNDPVMVFEYTELNLDTLLVGTQHDLVFPFVNQGNVPLIIERVSSTVSNLSPNWTKEPVMPGDTGFIYGHLLVSNEGRYQKSLVVESNDSGVWRTYLIINAVFVRAEESETSPKSPIIKK